MTPIKYRGLVIHQTYWGNKNFEPNKKSIFIYFLSPGGIPARNHKGERLLLYLGIIDILQSYQMRKKLEHTLKAIIQDAVSAGEGWFVPSLK